MAGHHIGFLHRILLTLPFIVVTILVICTIRHRLMILEKLLSKSSIGSKMFKNVCLGGTFDGIHAGHKLLFNEATRLSNERLVVGVTDGPMIKTKSLWELILPIDDRIEKVREYLHSVNPNITYQIVPITDLYGPTIHDKELECIVVSEETIKGANKINEARLSKGWPELKIHVVNLLHEVNESNLDAMSKLKENKVSSSTLRLKKLGTIMRQPEPNKSIPDKPYLIGLTGGIASGKTTIGKYLESMGFGYINYDLLGHKTYESTESQVYREIVEYFGDSILNKETKQIDRSLLGSIVFGDGVKLDKLKSLVWPAIYKLVDEEIERLKGDHDVIILESALLVESNQTQRVHQVWTTIIPAEEAIQRQMKSRGLSREEAEKRVNSQTDNLTRVKKSNVVFCTLWEPEFTQQQVGRCVQELREKYLPAR